jgi:hypothetical protein
MRLARYERAGQARLAMVAGGELLDILDALDALDVIGDTGGDAPAHARAWFSDMTALIEAGPAGEEIFIGRRGPISPAHRSARRGCWRR